MNKSLRFSILGILLIIFGGYLPSAAHAGPSAQSGTVVLSQIKDNPCNGGGEVSAGGGRTAYLCLGWKGVQGIIDVPVKSWVTSPEYPLVGVPFKIGIGVVPNYLRTQFPPSNITFSNEIRFFGYRTEIRLIPIKPASWFNWSFNGTIDYELGDSLSYTTIDNPVDKFGANLIVPSFFTDPIMSSASLFSHKYYPTKYIMVGDVRVPIPSDTVIINAFSSSSSYQAKNPTTYKGEPAFRLEVTSEYLVQARASWDSYQEWERVWVGERTECRPGLNNAGVMECVAIDGGWWQPGHYVTVDIYDYQWGPSIPWNEDSDRLNWVDVDEIDTNKVAWPDGSIHDHIPILIYQAQPLLQKP